MAESSHTLAALARHLIAAAQPLIQTATSVGAYRRLMAQLGFSVTVTAVPPPFASLGGVVRGITLSSSALGGSLPLDKVLALLADAKAIFDGVRNLGAAGAPAGADPAAYTAEIGGALTAKLLVDYLSRSYPDVLALLKMCNVVSSQTIEASATRPTFVRVRFAWDQLPKVISDPGGLPARAFGWGTPDFDVGGAFQALVRFFAGLRFNAALTLPDETLLRGYLGIPDGPLPRAGRSLSVPFIGTHIGPVPVRATFELHALPQLGGSLPGVVLEPRIPKEVPLQLQVHPKVRLRLRAAAGDTIFGIVLRPNEVALKTPLAPGTPAPAGGFGIGFDFTRESTVLIGDPQSSRLEFAGASIDLTADYVNGAWSVKLAPELKGLRFVLNPGDGDSFIRYLVGGQQAAIDVPLGLEWSQQHGIRFRGSAALEVAVHPHLSLGPISIDEVTIGLVIPVGAPGSQVRLDVGAAIAGKLGPLSFLVHGVGFRTDVSFAPGNAGPFDIRLGFKPPTGLGLGVDAGGFKGGGFLIFDAEKGEYAGGLELTFLGIVSVRAIGILSTRMPDGSEGFSLLLLIVSEFTPLQLGFGFTLVGVGGLLGLNRTMLLDVLQLGTRDGTLNSIMFPRDVVANAPRIINDLKRVFPPLDGRFLVGPMAKLGWGTPTLISLELGVILEIPRPAFAIVGVLRVNVPLEEAALIYFQVNFVGSVDFEKGQLQFDASLYNSRVMFFAVTGDMAIRVYWGEDANFLLSVGGFHPAYTPPPMNIGTMTRLGIVLFKGIPSIRAEAYFAVTSNSVQAGARLELYAGVDAFNIYGFLGMDVLIQFNPFHFIVEIAAMVAVRSGSTVLFGVRINMLLEGPAPWHARGEATFEISFIITLKLSVSFDVTLGDEEEARLPPIEVLDEIRMALERPESWRARLPATSNQHVTLRELEHDPNALIVHPYGALEASQKAAPLNETLQRFGPRRPATGRRFTISNVKLGGQPQATTPTREQFAPAQFFDMSDAEKLSRPSFAHYDAGVVIGADLAPRATFMRVREVVYELIYLPERSPFRLFAKLAEAIFHVLVGTAAVAQSPLSHAGKKASPLAPKPAAVAKEQYAIVSTLDLALHGEAFVFDSASAADQAIADLVKRQPELTTAVQVAPWTWSNAA